MHSTDVKFMHIFRKYHLQRATKIVRLLSPEQSHTPRSSIKGLLIKLIWAAAVASIAYYANHISDRNGAGSFYRLTDMAVIFIIGQKPTQNRTTISLPPNFAH